MPKLHKWEYSSLYGPVRAVVYDNQPVIRLLPVVRSEGHCVRYPLVVGVYRRRDWVVKMVVELYLRDHRN